MKFQIYVLSLAMLFLTACSDKVADAVYYIEQEGERYTGDVVKIKKAPFEIGSPQEGFSVVIAKKPIYHLADHKEIVKLTGTSGAWYPGQLPFYQRSDLLDDRGACLAYFGHEGEGCQLFIREKRRLGFQRHLTYTFAEYVISKTSMPIVKIGRDSFEALPSGSYYLYFFRSEDPMGKVARAQRVTRMQLILE